MKLNSHILLASILISIAFSLQLIGHNEYQHDDLQTHQDSPRPFYPKHYLGHRADAYKQKIKEQNKKKIADFNNNNKKKLKSAGMPGGNATQVTGGNSFVMGQTKFIEFTEDEFIKLFTGLNRAAAHHNHQRSQNKQLHKQEHIQTKTPKSHKLFENHLVQKINPDLAHDIQNHYEKVFITNQPSQQSQHGEVHDAAWSFDDPFSIDTSYLQNLYGNVNSDKNFGWDWKSLDKNYYSIPDPSNYWKSWQSQHWGFTKPSSGSTSGSKNSLLSGWGIDLGGWGSSSSSSSSSSSGGWWSDWLSTQTSNSNNDSWWSSDSWFSSTKPTNNTKPPIVQPVGPVQPTNYTKPTNNTKPPVPVTPTNNTSNKVIAAYAKDSMDVNWVIKGATTHIKQQGQCGSCWTYSAVGVIQAYLLIKGQGKMDLSEQQLVDCQRNRCQGCNGGFQNLGLQYAVTNGLVAEEKYPYRGFQQKCQHSTGIYKIPKYAKVVGRAKMEENLRKGPITGAVYVDDGFQFYQRGIFDKCLRQTANHAVVIVGFSKDFWIIRNSWGTDWGEDGHIRIKRDQNNKNACSIEDEAYAVSQ